MRRLLILTDFVVTKLSTLLLLPSQLNHPHLTPLPSELPENFDNDESFLKEAHKAICEVEVMEGALICPDTNREFPIQKGVANMVLMEDEV